jgi:APA family basic amino acid/polyamine antiporter
LHPKFGTPYYSNIGIGVLVCALAGFTPLKQNIQLASMGALFMFAMVAVSMMILRITHKDAKRPFKCPAAFLIGPIAVLVCMFLIWFLLPMVGFYFLAWLSLGLVMYFAYVRRFSPMACARK